MAFSWPVPFKAGFWGAGEPGSQLLESELKASGSACQELGGNTPQTGIISVGFMCRGGLTGVTGLTGPSSGLTGVPCGPIPDHTNKNLSSGTFQTGHEGGPLGLRPCIGGDRASWAVRSG